MKTRYVVLRTPKYFIVRCLFKFMRSCFVLLEIHSLFQIPLWKTSSGGSCFFSIKNSNLRDIQIVFIAANMIFRVSSSKKKTLWPLFMNRVQLPKVYGATTRRLFTFYHSVPRNSWYPFDQTWKDERLTQPWSHPVALNTGPLDWGSSALTNRPDLFVHGWYSMKTRYVILGTLNLLTVKNIINSFVCVGSRGIFQGLAFKILFSVLFFLKSIKKKHFRSTWDKQFYLVLFWSFTVFL